MAVAEQPGDERVAVELQQGAEGLSGPQLFRALGEGGLLVGGGVAAELVGEGFAQELPPLVLGALLLALLEVYPRVGLRDRARVDSLEVQEAALAGAPTSRIRGKMGRSSPP
jgi:hypothetical protein